VKAREFLSQHGIDYENRPVDHAPVNRAATRVLARSATRLLVKAGPEVLRVDARVPLSDADIDGYLVHQDGFLNVPVLLLDTLLIPGFTEPLYQEALGERPDPSTQPTPGAG
jgi:hypothetical protein